MLNCSQKTFHVIFDSCQIQFCKICQVWLTLLISENERYLTLTFKFAALDQVSIVFLPINEQDDVQLEQNEGCVDCRENPLDCILPMIPILIDIILVSSHGFENDSI